MEGKPVLHVGFTAREQGFKAVEPGIDALNRRALAVESGIEVVVSSGVARRRTRVVGNIGLDVALEAGLA